MRLKASTAPAWVEAVCADVDSFLRDHAACERKASAAALGFVAHYPDRRELVREGLPPVVSVKAAVVERPAKPRTRSRARAA